MSDTQKTCPSCGKPLTADAPQGLCPECLVRAGFGTTVPGTEAAGEPGFVPPSVADIAKAFPQLEILELLGKGGMGAVYKARQPALDRLVALKILPPRAGAEPGFAERFTREARALARLSHPNIVAVYDFGQAGGLHYLLMEYIDGANLRQIEQAGKLGSREALKIIPQICEALQFAHDEGIVHRDIKPENVLLDKKGRVKIADFGLARILGREPLALRLTGARDVMGTPHYMAPEQVEHPQEVDHRADIYSLGVVFYEMLTGELPLGKFAPPSRKVQVDVRLDEIVLRALEKEPALRYQHASDVKTDIETVAKGEAENARRPEGAMRPSPTGPSGTITNDERIRKEIKPPAIGLLVTGVLSWLLLPFVVAFLFPALSRAHAHFAQPPTPFFWVFLLATPFVLCSFLIYAALKMMRFEAYGAAVAASIVSMIVTPANCIGFPIGMWSLVVLSRREIREEFRRRAALSGGPSKYTTWSWLAIGAAGVILLGFMIFRQVVASHREPGTPVSAVAVFTPGTDTPISRDLALTEDNSWAASCTSTQTFRLFEISDPRVEQCILTYQARMKSEGLTGRAFLEMWCQFPGQGESFSRGLDNVLSGSNDWATYQTPFFLKAGERPDLIRLNLVVEGQGRVLIKDLRVISGPLP